MLVSLNELGITIGFLLAYLINFVFVDVDSGWRYMFALSAVPSAIQGLGMLKLPPSPRYLVLKNQDQKVQLLFILVATMVVIVVVLVVVLDVVAAAVVVATAVTLLFFVAVVVDLVLLLVL